MTLWNPEDTRVAESPAMKVRDESFVLRDYQAEDVDAAFAAWSEGAKGVVMRLATGLGKSVCAAELSRRIVAEGGGRVLVLIDVSSLANDLYRTIRKHCGKAPGMLTGWHKAHVDDAPIMVATIQTLYAGEPRRYNEFRPRDFSHIIIDECEGSVAERYSETVRYFQENKDIKIAGMTATPFRSDGKGMGCLYDYARDEPGPLNRDILWSVMQGWLVKPRQAFVKCDLDFSTLKLRKTDDEHDYTDADLTRLMMDQDEQQWRELAEGIHHFAKGQPSIVICPNSVDVAKLVAFHLCGAGDMADERRAQPIYGRQGQEAHDLIDSFKRGEYPYAVSVNMLYKGFDACAVRNVFMLRKTRSRRMYEQSMGRATRPLTSIREALNDAPDAEARRDIITRSAKPLAVMVDMVGVHPDAKDLGVIDILGAYLPDDLRERTKWNIIKSDEAEHDVGEQAREAQKELADERREREEHERKRRSLVQLTGKFQVEMTDDLGASGVRAVLPRGSVTDRQLNLLIAFGVKPATAMKMGVKQAGAVITSYSRRKVEPVWSRVNAWERGKDVGPPLRRPSEVPASLWQQGRLSKLGYDGPVPANAAEAIRLIHEYEKR